MPYTLKTNQISVKDPETGEYSGVDILAEQTEQGLIAELQAEGTTQVNRINQAAVDVQSAVDKAETDAAKIISDTQTSVNTLEAQKNTIAQTVASMAELGTDTTLSTPGMAADAGAVGDLSRQISDASSLYNKKVSILGDSISTYSGYLTPSSNVAYYPSCQGSPHADLTSVDQTWWKIVLDKAGMDLGVNNSYSGRTLIQSATTENITALAENGVPDIILVYLGTNDANQQVTLGQIDKTVPFNVSPSETYGETLGTNLTQEQVDALSTSDFYSAVRTLIIRLQWYYPNAKIVFLTLGWGSYERFFADNPYRRAMVECCELLGVDTIDVRKAGIHMPKFTDYSLQRVHPNKAGMKLIGEYVFNKLVSLFGAVDETRKHQLMSISYSGTLVKSIYTVGESFDPQGLTFVASYNDRTSEAINAEYISFTPTKLRKGSTSVIASFTQDEVTKTIDIEGITVTIPSTITTAENYKFDVKTSFNEMTFRANGSIKGVKNYLSNACYDQNHGRACPYITLFSKVPNTNGEILCVSGGETIVFTIPPIFTSLSWTLFELDVDKNIITGGHYGETWLTGNYTLNPITAYILVAFKVNGGSETQTEEQLAALKSSLTIQ